MPRRRERYGRYSACVRLLTKETGAWLRGFLRDAMREGMGNTSKSTFEPPPRPRG